jgi:hydrogenase maturation protein HypF
MKRIKIKIQGAVQGVGFRPFIYRLAHELQLTGWVINSSQGVFIEAEGSQVALETFLLRIGKEKPPQSFIQSLEHSFLDPRGYETFEIRESEESGEKTVFVLPDIATCPDCLKEIFDPGDRRYLYPFTNCTNCGPRFSIIEALPYDRPNTTMKEFTMCDRCRAEYENPADRRFHAQPNACPDCGPHLEFRDSTGNVLVRHHNALLAAAQAIREGKIAAVKGLGGFHLMVDAGNPEAVQLLRERKRREEKPFALMFPSLKSIKEHCLVSELEERLLRSAESPIVLLQQRKQSDPDKNANILFANRDEILQDFKSQIPNPTRPFGESEIAEGVAPGNPYLGALLPYTPLHYILMAELNFPIVATSGNISDEPICIDEQEALQRLSGIADFFLVHNRPIIRHVDDSMGRIMAGREIILRRARGYAPLPITVKDSLPPALAVGAHLKNTVAMSVNNQVFISQHIGDLETEASYRAFREVIDSFSRLYETEPAGIICDVHPGYMSTQYARERELPLKLVQHHYAHILACMAENELQPPVFGISWDGTGYGLDGTIWGGEFLLITENSFERTGCLRNFSLPGGEKAVKEPRRSALGLLYEVWGDSLFERKGLAPLQAFSEPELKIIAAMLRQKINLPVTSSAGRLFDGVASLVNLRQIIRFEGQAAMELEFLIQYAELEGRYDFQLKNMKKYGNFPRFIIDWESMVRGILQDVKKKTPVSEISLKFHNTLIEMGVAAAKRVGCSKVALSGGCFQNKYLTEGMVQRLREEGFLPYWHQRVPPNDGGISLGQIVAPQSELK